MNKITAARCVYLLAATLASLPAAALLPLEGIVQISAGRSHTCAITSGGGVKCWGANNHGQLGDGSTTSRSTPTDVSSLPSGVLAVAAGIEYTCALRSAGGVKCWGSNNFGQLGDNSIADRLAPVDVSGLTSGATAVAAGNAHACALTAGGGVKCWGLNTVGQLGNNSKTSSKTPVDVVGLSSGAIAIAAGDDHTCAIVNGGAVKCWGSAFSYGYMSMSLTPIDMPGYSSGVVAITLGFAHGCALTSGGSVKCWGENAAGQLGDGSLTSGVIAIAAGLQHTCAVTNAGAVKCWGDNQNGQIGDGTTTNRFKPVNVPGLSSGVAGITAGSGHTCALKSGGTVQCWGSAGLLGDNSPYSFVNPTATEVSGLSSGATAVSVGGAHACALVTGGAIKCWGYNYGGQLGDNTTTDRFTPMDVLGLPNGVTAISAGGLHTCAVANGGAKCWGYNYNGQLGDGSTIDRIIPAAVSGLSSGVLAVAAGSSHTCALTTAGGVKCWGDNQGGQLGNNTTTYAQAPVDVVGLSSNVAAIVTGSSHTCALTSGGGVKCWGKNASGQLGDDSTTIRLVPVDVVGLASGVIAIAAGGFHTCALTNTGAVKCWGFGYWGELGDGTTTDRPTPAGVSGLSSGVAGITGGYLHTCALTTAGGVKCWGKPLDGRLGDNSAVDRVPVDVAGLSSGVAAIDAGSENVCVLTTGGAVKCWGTNGHGQIGNGTGPFRASPGNVLVMATTIVSAPTSISNATSPAFTFIAAMPGTVECSLDGAPFAACTSPMTYGGLALGAHTFRVRARDGAGNPDPDPPTHSWTIVNSLLSSSASSLDFGGQSMSTTSPAMTVTLTNATGPPIAVTSTTAGGGYAVGANTCTTIATGASCQVSVTFTPGAQGAVGGWLGIAYAGGTTVVELTGVGERSLVTHYYRSILRRAPDAGGKTFWEGEATRVAGLGANVNETWFAMSQAFYTSAEYASFNRDNTGYATDLYNTFYNRTPDSGGLAFWKGHLDSGLPREVLLAQFMFSPEFAAFSQAIFGSPTTRAEVNAVTDFYRGLLARLPDSTGFNFWVGRFRAAQCQNQAAIVAEVEAISSAFATSGEYAARGRTNTQYVGDLYNAFLRRGGDLAGVQFWIDQISTGAQTREQVRVQFRNSPEFQARVNAIIQQGCMS